MASQIQPARGVTVRRVTSSPASHFFGYYDMPSWDISGRYLLTQRVNLDAEIPSADDAATIGTIDLEDSCRFRAVATTHAWSWQQGAMLHWLPEHGPNTIVFNDQVAGRYAARVMDINSGMSRVLTRPIAAVSHDQRSALSLNFARLRVRPEVGYPGLADPWEGVDHPEEDGIYLVDLDNGAAELKVSLDEIASVRPHPSMHGAINWVNHLIFSPDDTQAMFVHRWWPPGAPRYRTRFMLLRIDDGSVSEIWPTRASHMCWRSPTEILFSAIPADVPDDPDSRPGPMGFWLLDLASGDAARSGARCSRPTVIAATVRAAVSCSWTRSRAPTVYAACWYMTKRPSRPLSLGASIPRRATLARSAATCTRAGAVTAGRSASTPSTKAAARCM